jgi:3-keto-5-aminohexanoate cleavage enzyme
MNKLIVTVCPTGNVPTRENSPHAALTVDEIVRDVQKCAELGAAVAHIHVRDKDFKPTSDREIFRQVLDKLDAEKVDIVRQVSTGARGGENTIAWRGQMLDLPNAEMASLSTGSSNFPSSINANSPELIEALAEKMYKNDLVPEIEVFDTAMLFNAIYYQKKGILKGPLHFNLVMNVRDPCRGREEPDVPCGQPAAGRDVERLRDRLGAGADPDDGHRPGRTCPDGIGGCHLLRKGSRGEQRDACAEGREYR